VKKAKKFKKFSSLSRTFFKEREKRDIFAKLFFTIKKKTRTLAHARERTRQESVSSEEEEEEEEGVVVVFGHSLVARIKIYRVTDNFSFPVREVKKKKRLAP